METPIRIALIGCGGIMHVHARALREMKGAQVVALCDPNPGMIDRLVTAFPELEGIPTFVEDADVYAAGDVDAIILASPHTPHRDQMIRAFAAGCHVLCEKPLCTSVVDTKQVIAARDAAGKVGAIAYQRHGVAMFRWLREVVQSKRYGELRFMNSHLGQQWWQLTKGSWRQSKALSGGGQLNDSGSHMIDVLLWLTDMKARRVTAFIDDRDSEVDINSVVNMEFESGAFGSISIIGDAALWHERHHFWFEDAMIAVEDPVVWVTERNGTGYTVERWPAALSPVANFLAAIAGEEAPMAPFECGLRTIELTEAAWRSGYGGNIPVDVASLG